MERNEDEKSQPTSKRSNKDLIVQRKNFQNEMTFSIQKTNQRILSWMNPKATTPAAPTDDKSNMIEEFFSLPIIGVNQGLSLSFSDNIDKTSSGNPNSLRNIDSQIMSRKNLKNNGSTNSTNGRGVQNLLKVSANDSTSMKSLKNKLRSDKLKKLGGLSTGTSYANDRFKNSKGGKASFSEKSEQPKLSKHEEHDDEEDEEIEQLRLQKSMKKSTKSGFPFGSSKIKKRRK